MKIFTRLVLVSLLLIVAAPAYSDTSAHSLQIFICEYNNDETTDEELLEVAAAWLKAARGMKGGANMAVGVRFPIAEGKDPEGDFRFVISTPTFAEWGEFTDAYEGSAAAKVDDEFEDLADCHASTMWEGIVIK